MNVGLAWFRQDLRLADNDALDAAARSCDAVIPVYVWNPGDEGDWPPGAASRWWIHESLARLETALRAKGSTLILRRGPAAEILPALARETGATRLFYNARHEPAALRTEHAVVEALRREGVESLRFQASMLVEPGSIHGRSGDPLQVFTPFLEAFLKQVEIRAPRPSPPRLPAAPRWPTTEVLPALGLLPQVPWHTSLARHWQPGEQAARAQLKTFVAQGLATYDIRRDRPDLPGSSRLSPFLHHGELSARQVWRAAEQASLRQGTAPETFRRSKFIAELVWREYAAQQLLRHPLLADRPRDARFERLAWRTDDAQRRAWQAGRTGFALVDAGMRELWQTGWMHNRVRMVAASFLVKNLLLRWQDGERWFWDTLVDADLANNALNWQWVAGSSPDAAPWFRIFNPDTQAERFDPEGNYRRRFVPEAGTLGYSPPIIDLKASRQRALDAFAALRESP
jgi:deoxyribodipyrimidine photo-lyase